MALANDTFLRACRREPVEHTPVWFMRQAGRYLPEYRKLREKYDVLTLTQTPDLAAEISLQPIRTLGVDAAILFADIMLVPIAMGVPVRIVDSVGPVIDAPIRDAKAVAALRSFGRPEIEYLRQTIKLLRSELKVPLIGFSGAPFTLASYLIEGAPSRDWILTKKLMHTEPALWKALMTKLSDAVIFYLREQIEAGAQAVQLFDSWVGGLAPADFAAFVAPYNARIFHALADAGVPRIIFGTDTAGLMPAFGEIDCEVVGVDWRLDLRRARELFPKKTLQGNLDPAALLAGPVTTIAQADHILRSLPDRTGFIFNLGHGVPRETDPDTLKRLVDYVHTH
jgi:uroporphyrinogen decarboxylase